MTAIIGSLLCVLAGVGVGSFLLPLKFSRTWRWENSWLVGALFMYVLLPLAGLALIVPQFRQVYAATPAKDLSMIYLFGVIQGTGAFVFTYGTTLLGLSLGYALMISCIALFGMLVPLFGAHLDRVAKLDGITLLVGAALLILGFGFAGSAGLAREAESRAREGPAAGPRALSIPLAAAVILWSGFANALYYFTFEFQQTMKGMAIERFGVAPFAWGFLNIVPFFLGMFTTNLLMTLWKMVREGTVRNYWSAEGLLREYGLGMAIGLTWYLGQGVAYPVAQALLGPLGVAVGAALFMGMIMVVSTVAGLRTGEWAGTSASTRRKLYSSLLVLIVAMSTIAIGNYLQQTLFDTQTTARACSEGFHG